MRFAFLYSDVAFGPHRKPLDFTDVESQGLTGTDLISVFFPREMARRGHEVHLFIDRASASTPEWEGVRVHPFELWKSVSGQPWDVAVATSNPNALELCKPEVLRVVNRQVAAFGVDCKPGWQGFVDLVVCPSAMAVSRVRVDGPAFEVLGNGVDVGAFPRRERTPGRCLWISSPDRGLHWVLQAWPKIRARAPHATLRVMYYSIGSWLAHNAAERPYANAIDQEIGRRAQYIEHGLRRLRAHGVEVHETGVSHRALADELTQAECLLYPCDTVSYTETFGVAVLEAAAAGCLPIVSTADSFGELWAPACPHVDAPVGLRLEAWTELATRALTDKPWRKEQAARAKAHTAQYDWKVVGERFEQLCAEHRTRKATTHQVAVWSAWKAPESPGRLDMVLTPYASGEWPINPYDPFESPMGGGCRTGFVLLSRAMARLGWKVRAFSTWGGHDRVAGVEHRPLPELGRDLGDALLAYYDTTPLLDLPGPVRIASHHTYVPPNAPSIAAADVNVAPSHHAAQALQREYGGRGWAVLPNIVPTDVGDRRAVPGRVIYHTSADRGLHLLVKAWPEIRAAVPHATLHVVGATEKWLARAVEDKGHIGDRLRELQAALPAAKAAGGVRLLGRLTRGGVLREIAEASCFAFPCDHQGGPPIETWSTSVVECMAAGVPVVLAPEDALGELWGGIAATTPTPVRDHMRAFVGAVVQVLSDDACATLVADRQRAGVADYTAEHAARILDELLREKLASRRAA